MRVRRVEWIIRGDAEVPACGALKIDFEGRGHVYAERSGPSPPLDPRQIPWPCLFTEVWSLRWEGFIDTRRSEHYPVTALHFSDEFRYDVVLEFRNWIYLPQLRPSVERGG
jgi:hypothetical protein